MPCRRLPATLLAAAVLMLPACSSSPADRVSAELGLPDLQLQTAEHWQQTRRAEILALFERHVYGTTPTDLGRPAFEFVAVKNDALDGLATRKLVRISLPRYPAWKGVLVMLYVPNDAAQPVPCFAGLSFHGNHAVTTELDVPVSNDKERGSRSSRWPLPMILRRGFAVATAWYGDIEPDHKDGWRDGLRGASAARGGDTVWQEGEWGAIGAWAFGLRLIADYLEYDASVDGSRLAVIGHSRLGKTSLWAGAQDRRFSVVVSNDSGEGGAALMRRPVGETTANITSAFPHWFTATYSNYAADPSLCPVDQHMLIAAMAPRAVYIASAAEDTWADPEGEFLFGLCASPVYEPLGKSGIAANQWQA